MGAAGSEASTRGPTESRAIAVDARDFGVGLVWQRVGAERAWAAGHAGAFGRHLKQRPW